METEVKFEGVFLIGIHRSAFRAGEISRIVGVKMRVIGEIEDNRLCYEVKFEDGFIDYIPFSDVLTSHNYVFATLKELIENGVPEITK